MTESLREAGLAAQVVAYAYIALLGLSLVVMGSAPLFARLLGRPAKIPNPLELLAGVGLVIGLPAAIAAAMALLVTPILIAMPLPLAGWLLIAGLSLYGFSEAQRHPGSGMEGCTKLLIAAFSGFGLCWSAAAVLLADPPAGDIASFVRPVIVAAPLALFIGKHSRKPRWRNALGFWLVIAIFLAVAFLPVEQGFAAGILPESDWLRFPIMGVLVFGVWPLLAIPLSLIFGSRALDLRRTFRAMAAMGLVGGLFGLVWAITRLLF